MKFEGLTLEVAARTAGMMVVKPPVLHGKSGVDHRFDGLVSDGVNFFAFDFYDSVNEMDVLRTYIKKFDTSASVSIVSASGHVVPGAATLAREYRMDVLSPDGLSKFFSPRAMTANGAGHRLPV